MIFQNFAGLYWAVLGDKPSDAPAYLGPDRRRPRRPGTDTRPQSPLLRARARQRHAPDCRRAVGPAGGAPRAGHTAQAGDGLPLAGRRAGAWPRGPAAMAPEPPGFSPQAGQALIETLHQPPTAYGLAQPRWRLADLWAVYPAVAGYSLSGLSQALRRLGVRRHRGRLGVHSPDPDYAPKLAAIAAALAMARAQPAGVSLVYADEFTLTRQPTLAAVWAAQGTDPVARLSQRSNTRWRYSGALDAVTGRVTTHAAARMGVEELGRFLRRLRAAYPDRRLILDWDRCTGTRRCWPWLRSWASSSGGCQPTTPGPTRLKRCSVGSSRRWWYTTAGRTNGRRSKVRWRPSSSSSWTTQWGCCPSRTQRWPRPMVRLSCEGSLAGFHCQPGGEPSGTCDETKILPPPVRGTCRRDPARFVQLHQPACPLSLL